MMCCAGLRGATWEAWACDCHRWWGDIILHGGGVNVRCGDGVPSRVLNAACVQGNRNISIGCCARWRYPHRVDVRGAIYQSGFTDSGICRAWPIGTDIRCGESIGTGAECLREIKRNIKGGVRPFRSADNHGWCVIYWAAPKSNRP